MSVEVKWRQKKWQQFYGRPTNCAIIVFFFFALFVTYFVHNVSATIFYGKKELLDIRTAITHLGLDKDFFLQQAGRTGHSPNTRQLFARERDAGKEDTEWGAL